VEVLPEYCLGFERHLSRLQKIMSHLFARAALPRPTRMTPDQFAASLCSRVIDPICEHSSLPPSKLASVSSLFSILLHSCCLSFRFGLRDFERILYRLFKPLQQPLLKNNPGFLEGLHRCVARDDELLTCISDAVLVSKIESPSRLVTLAATIIPVSKVSNKDDTLTICDVVTDRLIQFVDGDPIFVDEIFEVFMANCARQEVLRKWFMSIFPAFLKSGKYQRKMIALKWITRLLEIPGGCEWGR
jgi:hypothetical protein